MVIKEWARNHGNISLEDFIILLDSLAKGESHQEKTSVGKLLEYLPTLRKRISLSHIDNWLQQVKGWAEVDSLCQNKFTVNEVLQQWTMWKPFLINLSQDRNINKRRASIVFLTGPVSYSANKQLSQLAFQLINQLKHEKHILITKAISWLLRSMVRHYREEVQKYIEQNMNKLPKIALREARIKLETGVKNQKKKIK